MKKVFILLLLALGLNSFAQDRKEKHSRDEMERFTPEQHNQLLLKKMVLELDLTAKQQEQISKLMAEETFRIQALKVEHKAKKEKNREERFEMRNKMLDEKIAVKNKLKEILTPEQLTKWESRKRKGRE